MRGAEVIESACFAPPWRDPESGILRDARLDQLFIMRLDDAGRPFEGLEVVGAKLSKETYLYDPSGKLSRIEIPWPPVPLAGLDKASLQVLLLTYGDDGSLVALDQEWDHPLMPNERLWPPGP